MKFRIPNYLTGGCRPGRLAALVRRSFFVLSLTGLFAVSASAAPLVYVVTLNQQFGTIDLSDGHFTPIGEGTPDGLANLMWSPGGSLLSLGTTGSHAGYLVKINPETGSETALRPITYKGQPLGFNAFSLAEFHHRLYLTDFSNNLYLVNPATGNATRVGENGGTTGLRPDVNVPFTTNPDGTFNLCDEGLYEFDGKLYATFDSFAINTSLTPPTIAHQFLDPYLWKIDPSTGAATFVANTNLQISAIVKADGKLYAFEGVLDSFENGFPVAHAELDILDPKTGKSTRVADIDPGLGLIFGATPVNPWP